MLAIIQRGSKVMQRRLILDNVENCRDLGGYPTANGQQTRWRSFVRTDHLQLWTAETQWGFIDYGVQLVIDLRDNFEILEHPSVFAQSDEVKYINAPLMTDAVHLGEDFQTVVHNMNSFSDMYQFWVDHCRPQIGSILTTIATHHAQTTLFHCHSGKDRTGLIAALLLNLAGVSDDLIAQDFALTSEYLAERFAQRRARALAAGEDMERFERFHDYSPQTILTTMDYIRKQHGSIPDFLRACGVSDAHMNMLCGMLTEEIS
jgi:protein-tyrosine phosphatase